MIKNEIEIKKLKYWANENPIENLETLKTTTIKTLMGIDIKVWTNV